MKEVITSHDEEMRVFFDNALRKIYWAKKNLVSLLDQMSEGVLSKTLRNTIEEGREQTKAHVQRLQQVFNQLGQQPEENVCEAMKGLLKDAADSFSTTSRKTRNRDMGIRASLIKVEHYEMASYAMLLRVSEAIGWPGVTKLLDQNIEEARLMEDLLLNAPTKDRHNIA